jgi:hypothetical protein
LFLSDLRRVKAIKELIISSYFTTKKISCSIKVTKQSIFVLMKRNLWTSNEVKEFKGFKAATQENLHINIQL